MYVLLAGEVDIETDLGVVQVHHRRNNWGFPKIGVRTPRSSNFERIVHYKPY